MSLLTRKQQWRRCRQKRRAESCDISLYDDLLKALHESTLPSDGNMHKVASAPELYTLSRNRHSCDTRSCSFGAVDLRPEGSSVVASRTTCVVEKLEPPGKKHVRFAQVVNVVLIPTRKEYLEVKLNEELWWDDHDYMQFKSSAMEEYFRRMQLKKLQQQQQEALRSRIQSKHGHVEHEQTKSMRHVDSMVITQHQKHSCCAETGDDLYISDIHTDGSTEASSVDECEEQEFNRHHSDEQLVEAGISDDGKIQKRLVRSDSETSTDSEEPIHHLDSLEIKQGYFHSSLLSLDKNSMAVSPASPPEAFDLPVLNGHEGGFQEVENFLRQHVAYYEWKSIPNSQQAVMI